jgi:rRNA-processing protein FCF1
LSTNSYTIEGKNDKLSTQENVTLRVILDANFLFIPLQFNVDIFDELSKLLNRRYEPVILSSTQKELEGLAESSSQKTQKQALLALSLAKKCSLVNIEKSHNESYDDVIVRIASKWKVPVGTNDRDLRKRLRKNGIPVIFLRQKRRFEMFGAV